MRELWKASIAALLAVSLSATTASAHRQVLETMAAIRAGAETVQAAAEAATAVRDFLNGGSRSESATRAALASIAAQNRVTHRKLDEILSILSALDVTMRQAVRDELLIHATGGLLARVELVEALAPRTFEGRNRDEARRRLRDHRSDIEALSNQLMRYDLYGYAHYDALGQSLFAEALIQQRTGGNRQLLRDRARAYLAFFDTVADPTVAGSVGHVHQQRVDRLERLRAILDEADASLANEVYETTASERSSSCDTPPHTVSTFGISGGRGQPYQVVLRTQRRVSGVGCGRRAGDGPTFIREPDASTEAADLPLPDDPGTVSVEARVNYLNRILALAEEDEALIPILRSSLRGVLAYRASAEALAAQSN